MGWTLESSEKETRDEFAAFIREHISLLKEKDIYIWGAGVRGTLLGILLEQYALRLFCYLDSNKLKWNHNINGHVIVSPESVSVRNDKKLILVPVEYPEAIQKMLNLWEYIEGVNFFIVRSSEERRFVEEFYRIYGRKRLILGDSFFNEVPLKEKSDSMKQLLQHALDSKQTKILAMNCMGMRGIYHIIRLQIINGQKPEKVWLWSSFEMLTKHHHLLPRSQHMHLMQMIQERGNIIDNEFLSYLQEISVLIKNDAMENLYSPRRTFQDTAENKEIMQKEYMESSLLYDIDENNTEVIYLNKILHMLQKEKIEGCLICMPVNEDLAQKYEPELFRKHFDHNNRMLKNIAEKYDFCYIDTSGILEESDFLASVTINDALSESGRIKLISYLQQSTNMFED